MQRNEEGKELDLLYNEKGGWETYDIDTCSRMHGYI